MDAHLSFIVVAMRARGGYGPEEGVWRECSSIHETGVRERDGGVGAK